MPKLLPIGALLLGVVLFGTSMLTADQGAGAAGPCDTNNAGVTQTEWQFHVAVDQWRAANLGAPPMTLSGPANKAAQWFAEAMIAGTTYDHYDEYGRDWNLRLADCGWPGRFGAGESIAGFVSASVPDGNTVDDALKQIVDAPSMSGIEAPVGWKCAGVGFSQNPSATGSSFRYAWVIVVVQFGSCPEPVTGPGGPPTVASTNRPTSSPTSSPTPPPTPTMFRFVAPGAIRE